ncbi:hypothetical protein ACN47E_005162 [Coniothyrium glycines]
MNEHSQNGGPSEQDDEQEESIAELTGFSNWSGLQYSRRRSREYTGLTSAQLNRLSAITERTEPQSSESHTPPHSEEEHAEIRSRHDSIAGDPGDSPGAEETIFSFDHSDDVPSPSARKASTPDELIEDPHDTEASRPFPRSFPSRIISAASSYAADTISSSFKRKQQHEIDRSPPKMFSSQRNVPRRPFTAMSPLRPSTPNYTTRGALPPRNRDSSPFTSQINPSRQAKGHRRQPSKSDGGYFHRRSHEVSQTVRNSSPEVGGDSSQKVEHLDKLGTAKQENFNLVWGSEENAVLKREKRGASTSTPHSKSSAQQESESQLQNAEGNENEEVREGVQQIIKSLAETKQALDTTKDELASSKAHTLQLESELHSTKKAHEVSQNEIKHLLEDLKTTQTDLTARDVYISRLPQSTIPSLPFSPLPIPSPITDPQPFLSWQSADLAWYQRYISEKALHQALQTHVSTLEATVQQAHAHTTTIQALRADLTTTRTALARMTAQKAHYKHRALAWAAEAHLQATQTQTRITGLEAALHSQTTETLSYIAAYRAKLADPRYWSLASLHRTVAALERDLAVTTDLFDSAKAENAGLHEAVRRLGGMLRACETYVASMERAFVLGEPLPGPFREVVMRQMRGSASASDRREDGDGDGDGGGGGGDEADNNPRGHGGSNAAKDSETGRRSPVFPCPRRYLSHHPEKRVPRCHLPTAIARREHILSQYRVELASAARRQDLLDDVLERLRRWKLGDMGFAYPPGTRHWNKARQVSSWERWDGRAWVQRLRHDPAGYEDLEMVKGLVEKGMIAQKV